MSPDQMMKDAIAAKAQGAFVGMTLVLPRKFKRPSGFPRGELLSETERGKVYSFNPDKIIAWLKSAGFEEPHND